jgi:hypothetical protein
MTPRLTLDGLRGRATISVPEAGAVLGISTKSAYLAASRGEIPMLRFNARILVPVPALLRLLGDDPGVPAEGPGGVTALREVTP